MTHGETHAKKTVLMQVDAIEQKLGNESKADPEVQGAGILLLLQMIRPIFEARLVTEEECERKMSECTGSVSPGKGLMRLKLGHISVIGGSGTMSVAFICYTVLKLTGKM